MFTHDVDQSPVSEPTTDGVATTDASTDAQSLTPPRHEKRAETVSPRSITALAVVQLSARGRLASLQTGGDGRLVQRIHVPVSPADADLVRVNARGEASLVLGPRVVSGANGQLRRVPGLPVYDELPSPEQLVTDARALATLNQVYVTQRSLAHTSAKEELARTFFQDSTMRAIVHPPPTARWCAFRTDHGVQMFRHTDEGVAGTIPVEAHRRFRADLAERSRKNQSQAAADMAIHQAKHLAMARWIEQHGSAEQQARLSAGRLSDAEMYEAIADVLFAPLHVHTRYVHDARGDLVAHYRRVEPSAPCDIPASEVKVESTVVVHLSAAQWRQLTTMQAAMPQAFMTVRRYRLYWNDRPARHDPQVLQYAVLVKHRLDPLTLVRSYVLPPPDDSSGSTGNGETS